MSDDLIRRSDAIKAIDECFALLARLRVTARQALEAVPSADRLQDDEFKNFDRESLILLIEAQKERIGELLADRPTGEWKEVYAETDYRNGWIEFSCECCEYQHGLESGEYGWSYGEPIPWKFCPLCGARMKGAEDE